MSDRELLEGEAMIREIFENGIEFPACEPSAFDKNQHGEYENKRIHELWMGFQFGWQAARSKPMRLPDPTAWRIFDGEGSFDFRLYEGNENYRDDFITANPKLSKDWVEPLYLLDDIRAAGYAVE